MYLTSHKIMDTFKFGVDNSNLGIAKHVRMILDVYLNPMNDETG